MTISSTRLLVATAAVLGALLVVGGVQVATGAAPQSAPAYTKTGELVLPADYRNWTFLTSNINMGYPSEGPPPANRPTTFGNVFVNPDAYRAFMASGTWPDRTVMIIENREASHTAALNEDARFQTAVSGLEFHVKDAARGGWIFYYARAGATSAKPFPKTQSCYSCHEQHAAVDTTFVQYYPTLIDIAKQKGTYRHTAD